MVTVRDTPSFSGPQASWPIAGRCGMAKAHNRRTAAPTVRIDKRSPNRSGPGSTHAHESRPQVLKSQLGPLRCRLVIDERRGVLDTCYTDATEKTVPGVHQAWLWCRPSTCM